MRLKSGASGKHNNYNIYNKKCQFLKTFRKNFVEAETSLYNTYMLK